MPLVCKLQLLKYVKKALIVIIVSWHFQANPLDFSSLISLFRVSEMREIAIEDCGRVGDGLKMWDTTTNCVIWQ